MRCEDLFFITLLSDFKTFLKKTISYIAKFCEILYNGLVC